MRNLHPCVVLLAVALGASGAHAGSASGTFQVTGTVVSSCNVSGALLNFGAAIDPLSSAVPIDATSSLTVQCTNTTPYSVALDAGTNAGGASSFANRAMKNGAHSLGYQLYLNAGRSSVWGDGTGGSAPATGTGTGSSQTLTIYGRLPVLGSTVVPGTYTDTVTVTITY